MTEDPGRGERTVWHTVAKVLAIAVAVAGLVGLGALILFVVAMNSWANNK